MKIISEQKIVFFLCAIGIFLFFIFSNDPIEGITEKEKTVWAVSLQTAKEFKDKYDLQFIGIGQSGDDKLLKSLRLSFILDKILSKDEGRKLVLNCVKKLLDNVNGLKKNQPFLIDTPFLENNLGITVYFYKDQEHSSTVYPDICCITVIDGLIYYRFRDPNPPFLYKFSEEETMEDAKRIIN